MGKVLFVIGLLGIVFTTMYDKIVGKTEIIFGPKSCSALVLCALLIVVGLIFWRK